MPCGCVQATLVPDDEWSRGMDNVIEVNGLSKRYGALDAVDELSFVARREAVTGFLGPNGAGKPTTLKMLLGLAVPTPGAPPILGRACAALTQPVRHVGAVLESTGFHPARR